MDHRHNGMTTAKGAVYATTNGSTGDSEYERSVNPQWVKLLNILQLNVQYDSCQGAELFASDGRTILDFLSGYCVHNTGHNHPGILRALHDELDRRGPVMLQSNVPALAGELAHRLCDLAGGGLSKAFFCSSGSEGVEAAIKFARAHTRRSGLLYFDGAFHGLTCGALSMMGDAFWRDGFGPMLPDTAAVPFNDLPALTGKLASRQYAALFIEPIQAEAGIQLPDPEYLAKAQALCNKYGTLLVSDEVQTGMYRTGSFLAGHRYGITPDMVVLAKALSGGLVPVGAVLMRDDIYGSVYTSLKRSIVHTSTFSENSLSMRVGLATLDVLQNEQLGARAVTAGDYLRRRLAEELSGFEMVKAVRGAGLLSGVEFTAPSSLRLRAAFEAFRAIHTGMFGQVLVMRMFRDHNILTQMCGNNFMVLKAAPPLMVSDEQLDTFVAALRNVVELAHTTTGFWSEALGLARRAVNI